MNTVVSIDSKRIQSAWATASTIGISIFAVCVFLYPKGYILGSSILLLMSLVAGYCKQLTWHKNLTLLAIAFAIFIIPHLISLSQGTGTISDLKKAARGIPLLLIGSFLVYHRPKKEMVYVAFAIGLIISFLVMLNEQMTGFNRNYYAGFHINPLMMAVVAVLAFILPKTNSKTIPIRIMMYTAFTLTISTIIMSQSKGPTLSLITVVIVYSFLTLRAKHFSLASSKKNVFLLWLLMLSSATITSSFTNGGLTARITKASQDVIEHIDVTSKETKMSSSAVRLELWKGALILVSEKPILGYGKLEAKKRMLELVDEGRIAEYAKDFTQSHFHSLYFQALGNRGIVGLFSVLLLLIIPSCILLKNRNVDPLFSFSGLLVIINYLVAGAGDVSLSSTLPAITFFVLMILCISQVTENNTVSTSSGGDFSN